MPLIQHHRFTWKGVFGLPTAPLEAWQFSLKATDTSSNTASDFTTLATALKTCYDDNLAGRMGPETILTETEVAVIEEDGKYGRLPSGAYRQGKWLGSVPGRASQGVRMPLQTALAISLDTPRPGPTGKGRFFLPWPSVTLDAGHRLEAGYAQGIATTCAEFIRDVSLVAGPVSVFSSKGYASPVTQVRVGRAPDTMRSRRGDMIEGYLQAAI